MQLAMVALAFLWLAVEGFVQRLPLQRNSDPRMQAETGQQFARVADYSP